MRFTSLAAHTEEFHVTTMCHVLKVKRAGYYARVHEELKAQGQQHGEKRVARSSKRRDSAPKPRAASE